MRPDASQTATAASVVSATTSAESATSGDRHRSRSCCTGKASRPHQSSQAPAQDRRASSMSSPLTRFTSPSTTSNAKAAAQARRRRRMTENEATISARLAGTATVWKSGTARASSIATRIRCRQRTFGVSAEARLTIPMTKAVSPASAGSPSA